jgi:ABC-2 type transport system permease protein
MRGFNMMVRRQIRMNRVSVVAMAAIWAVNNVAQVTAYNSLFPNSATRVSTLASFTSNGALRALYGYPYDISSPTGWLAWRAMGFVVIVMAAWAAFVTIGALRGEEEAGRAELALSQPQSRRTWFAAALVAVMLETLIIGITSVVGLTLICVTNGLMSFLDTLAIGLQLTAPAFMFVAVGALISQLVGTARGARIAAAVVLLVALLLRTAADAGRGIPWLRWCTPLGWFEELHPPIVPSPWALIAIVASTLALVALSLRMLRKRDIGRGLLPQRDARRPRRILLGSPWQAALRDGLPQTSFWVVGVVLTLMLMGSLTKTLLDLVNSNSAFSNVVGRHFAINAYIAGIFSLVQLAVALFVVTAIVGARREEASGRLELLIAEPMSRIRWLLSRAALASIGAVVLAALSALSFWVGALITGQAVSADPLFEAAANCLPLIVLATGFAVALLAIAPRAVAFVYAPVGLAYLWEALGTAFQAPHWTLNLSPFHWLAAVPPQDFAAIPVATLTGIGVVLLVAGCRIFRGRDLQAG